MVRHLFLAQSPLQIFLSGLSRVDRGIDLQQSLLVIIESSHSLSNAQMREQAIRDGWSDVVVLDEYPPMIPEGTASADAEDLRVAALHAFIDSAHSRLGHLRGQLESITVGDLREGLARLILGEVLAANAVFAVDDGSITPQVAMSRWNSETFAHLFDPEEFSTWRFDALASRAGFESPVPSPERVHFHSIYDFPVAPRDFYTRLSPTSLTTPFVDLRVVDEVWIVGNNHVDAGIAHPEGYFEVLASIVATYPGHSIRYLPHRKESDAIVNDIGQRFGFSVERSEVGLEMRIITEAVRPKILAGTASTVFDFMEWYSEGAQERVIFDLPESYFTGKRRNHLRYIQGYHHTTRRAS